MTIEFFYITFSSYWTFYGVLDIGEQSELQYMDLHKGMHSQIWSSHLIGLLYFILFACCMLNIFKNVINDM